MRVVGLTGGIASGKSTVSALLRDEGFTIIDCDKIAHDVVRKDRWGYRRVLAAFGSRILGPDGELDRALLGELVFSDAAARRKLNQATHLPVALEILRQLIWCWLIGRTVVIVDMPLLFETRTNRLTKPNLLVYTDDDTQVQRLIARDGLQQEAALARVRSQMPLQQKLQLADVKVDNSGTVEELKLRVHQLAGSLRRVGFWHHVVSGPGVAVIAVLVWLAGHLRK